MNLLLDTHVFIWWDINSKRLSSKVVALLRDNSSMLFLSLASVWEMQIKIQLGKMGLDTPLLELIEEYEQKNGLQILPIKLEHIFALQHLPFHHKDPFDRLLIAQAQTENLTLVSNDPALSNYQLGLVW